MNVLFSSKFFRNKCGLVVGVSAHRILEESLPAEIGCLKSFKGHGKCVISARERILEKY
jgi:hypothetical protein